jgi:hypothetical protein
MTMVKTKVDVGGDGGPGAEALLGLREKLERQATSRKISN